MAETIQTPQESLDIVRDALSDLGWMRGFPDDTKSFEFISKSYDRFAHTVEMSHSKLNGGRPVIPIRWLVEEIGNTRDWFPSPVEARGIYAEYFTPKDGKEPPAKYRHDYSGKD
jgi:hypothetical protein